MDVRQAAIKEAYAALKEHDLYFKDAPAIKTFNKVCYDFIYNNATGKGEIPYPEVNKKIVYKFCSYRPPVIKLVSQ